MGKIFKDVFDVAEELGWKAVDLKEEGFIVDEGITQVEFVKHSPAGEDFSFTVESDTPEGLIEEIERYSADFDTEEHIEMWIEAKRDGVPGVPTIKELVKDADDIQDMLRELAEAVTYGKNKVVYELKR